MNASYIVAAIAAVALFAWSKRDDLATYAVNVREFIMGLEGFSATAYADDNHSTPDKVEYSIGYGHQITGKETTNDPELLLDQDIATAQAAVVHYVVVPLSPSQLAALTSLVYNIGAANFASSTLVRKLNAGDYLGAADEFDRWIYAGGKTSDALRSRRAQEKALFLA